MYDGTLTMGALVAARAETEPERTVVRTDRTRVTYGDLEQQGNRLARAVAGLGLAKGDKAAVMLANGAEFMTSWVGLAKAGVVEVPVNTAFKGDLLAYVLNQSDSRLLVVAEEWLDRLEQVASEVQAVRHVAVVGEARPIRGLDVVTLAELLAAGDDRSPGVDVGPYDHSVILFTSGTTGPSKGAVLTHNANFRVARNVCELMDYGADDVLYNAFPLFHVNARYTGVLCAMLVDSEIVLHPRFSASAFWDTCRAEGITAFNYMGALLMMLHKQPERDDDDQNPVRRAYGAPAPVTIYESFERRFGVQLVEVYGSTEAGTVTMNTVDSFRIGSCGRPVPYFEVEVHDEHDRPCPPGVDGEICVRPAEPHVLFEEYYGMPEATLEAFRNLWFHTGDRAHTDADGYFYFVDRMKDAIRRRGENISSWEVEKVLNSHPAVEEAAVVGVPSELTEEEVLAVVVPKAGARAELTPESLLDLCQERLPYFAVPRYVRFVEELPKTPSQRVEKYKLREQGLTAATWDGQAQGYEVRR